uniref:Uncharacterized protein n=1 Tax=Aegilops tauschii subsp. strangulata TaxID=200361 RepID=A0A453RIF4_AEGTS
MYEGTRTAREEDFSGIRKILRPLEESGVLVQRTDKETAFGSTEVIYCRGKRWFNHCVCCSLSLF